MSSSSSSLTQVHDPLRTPSSKATVTTTNAARLLKPTTLPIPVLPSSTLAKRCGVAHTLVVPAYYYVRASAFVADPLPTMITDLVVVGLAQAVYCAVCLPGAGSWVSGTLDGKIIEGTAASGAAATSTTARTSKGSSSSAPGGSMRRKGGHGGKSTSKSSSAFGGDGGGANGNLASRIMSALLSMILTLTLPPLPLTVMALVLGAPLYPISLLPHTAVLALHVSVLGFLPIFYTHGVSSTAWREVAAAWLPFDEAGVWAGTVGALVGGWVGAVPMALDWDREWQKWPCTVLWGAVLGWVVGRVLTSILGLGVGKRINLSEHEEEVDGLVVAVADGRKSD
ncbi:hypothetical protein PV08_06695 [Exophiala spinifera]|uniref:Glycosylphosphatidylinositol anchor biosynthesis protein 11 n=1 Tax=Exophiala spinifera TaxID=91928 RepID=A0A0D2BRR3_9EURO|nr:uncharacterized protein PV08_06695 [Exophiala spinifera]KIW13914.1 hypothetical protein PV08_06695 [Exophiala spinifera]